MRARILLFSILLIYAGCKNSKRSDISKSSFDSIMIQRNNEIKKLWEEKKYKEFILVIGESLQYAQKNTGKTKAKELTNNPYLYYVIANSYSMLNQKDSAIGNLQKAIDLGYTDYYGVSNDTSFKNIRNDKRYEAIIVQLKKNGSYEEILMQFPTYKNEKQILPIYAYQSSNDDELQKLRVKYKLDSIAGEGDEISRIIRLMGWAHSIVRHGNDIPNPSDRHADAIIELCKKEKRNVNCRMLATILNETYLAMGFQSHFVTCLPKNKTDTECHVINCVFSKTLDKWIWMDPTFDTWVKDEVGNFLSIEEVRERLVKGLPVKTSPGINYNGKAHDGNEYLHHYMAKNLFQLQIPIDSYAAFESANSVQEFIPVMLPKLNQKMPRSYHSEKLYIQLIPVEYKPENIEVGKRKNNVYYTNDAKQFWLKP